MRRRLVSLSILFAVNRKAGIELFDTRRNSSTSRSALVTGVSSDFHFDFERLTEIPANYCT
ncbi:MAG: hypothetical protein IPL01_17400 [Acidobacteria bacterium]|nr:hypothetical protein [Acidobacteriota bacterium]